MIKIKLIIALSKTRLQLELIYQNVNSGKECWYYLKDMDVPLKLYKKIVLSCKHIDNSQVRSIIDNVLFNPNNKDHFLFLLSQPNVHLEDKKYPILQYSAFTYKMLISKILINLLPKRDDIEVNSRGVHGTPILVLLCSRNVILIELIKGILKYSGTDVNLIDNWGKTALWYIESKIRYVILRDDQSPLLKDLELIKNLIINHPTYKGNK